MTDVVAPLASCIMPTANRRRFVPGAIAQFLAQDYNGAELVILDDGDDPVADLIPSHPAIRYVRTPRHRSLGAKRNAACEAARGDVILHWDDDDWYAPHRIRIQVKCTRAAPNCAASTAPFSSIRASRQPGNMSIHPAASPGCAALPSATTATTGARILSPT
jgi:glycosyltransferase involved in cell wall biosynthesis